VGVDVERSDRPLSLKAMERTVRDSERHWIQSAGLQGLDFWVLKEAAFKATPGNKSAVIADLTLTRWDSQMGQGMMESALLESQNLSCRVMRVEGSGLKAAFAYTFKSGQ
jgi:hypothetical protein